MLLGRLLCSSGLRVRSCVSRVSLSSTVTFGQFFNALHQQKDAKLVESCPESYGTLSGYLTPLSVFFAAHWPLQGPCGRAFSLTSSDSTRNALNMDVSSSVCQNDAIDMSDLPTSIEHLLVPGPRSAGDSQTGRSVRLSPEIASRKVYAVMNMHRCRVRLP